MTSKEMKASLKNPATSYWLLKAIEDVENRDALDMARDASILAEYCELRLNELEVSYMKAVR